MHPMTKMSRALVRAGIAHDEASAQRFFALIAGAFFLSAIGLTIYAFNMSRFSGGQAKLFPETQAALSNYAEQNDINIK
jgi:hypothetical protein